MLCLVAQPQASDVTVHSSYLTVIEVHEMHGRMHPNYCQITISWVKEFRGLMAFGSMALWPWPHGLAWRPLPK